MKMTRREFLQAGSLAPFVKHPLVTSLAGLFSAAAIAADLNPTDYKAIVCVFLNGGNDWANTVVPYDHASFAAYESARRILAYSNPTPGSDSVPTIGGAPITKPDGSEIDELKNLSAHTLTPVNDRDGNPRQFALAPVLGKLHHKFNTEERMAVLMNVGTLIEPVDDKALYPDGAEFPPRLFSHNDQTAFWQSSGVEGQTTGWGGKTEDPFLMANGESPLSCISVSGNALFLTGEQAVQYQVTTTGAVLCPALNGTPLYGSSACSSALSQIITATDGHMFEREYARITSRSLGTGSALNAALAAHSENDLFGDNASYKALRSTTSTGAANLSNTNSLGKQLGVVARIIAAYNASGLKRQVFYVSVGGWDMHSDLAQFHPAALRDVSDALAAFDDFNKAHAAWDEKVTLFTASEFGRTVRSNDDGSDHGWGSMQFVLGGAVQGKQCYGVAPLIYDPLDSTKLSPDDIGAGRLLPTMAVEQVAATLAKWFGITSAATLESLFGNLENFRTKGYDVGFMKSPTSDARRSLSKQKSKGEK